MNGLRPSSLYDWQLTCTRPAKAHRWIVALVASVAQARRTASFHASKEVKNFSRCIAAVSGVLRRRYRAVRIAAQCNGWLELWKHVPRFH